VWVHEWIVINTHTKALKLKESITSTSTTRCDHSKQLTLFPAIDYHHIRSLIPLQCANQRGVEGFPKHIFACSKRSSYSWTGMVILKVCARGYETTTVWPISSLYTPPPGTQRLSAVDIFVLQQVKLLAMSLAKKSSLVWKCCLCTLILLWLQLIHNYANWTGLIATCIGGELWGYYDPFGES